MRTERDDVWVVWIATCVVVGCGSAESPSEPADGSGMDARPPASGEDAGAGLCGSDAECDDGVFCNGAERCAADDDAPEDGAAEDGAAEDGAADAYGCVTGAPPECREGQSCDEDARRCLADCHLVADADMDGARAVECGGDDCDDSDPNAFPGNVEVCDPGGHDEDCDPTTYGYRDRDGDGFPDAECCNVPAEGAPICGTDCDDMLGAVHPTEAESCDGLDNDCDGDVDEGQTKVYYPDADGDDFGDASAEPVTGCEAPEGYVDNAGDCDDTRRGRNPGAPEVCDEIPDNDCDMDNQPFDADGDGWDDPSCGGNDCRDDEATVHPGALEVCDRLDSDCSDGGDAAPLEDADGDGFAAPVAACVEGARPMTDCDDTSPWVFPGAVEHCNGIDDDCDPGTPEPDGCGAPTARHREVGTIDGRLDLVAVLHDASSGTTFLGGNLKGTLRLGETEWSVEDTHGFLAAIDEDGQPVWSHLIEGRSSIVSVLSLALGPDGRLHAGGVFSGDVTVAGATLEAGTAGFVAVLDAETGAVQDLYSPGRDVVGIHALEGGDVIVCDEGTLVETQIRAARWSPAGEVRWFEDFGSYLVSPLRGQCVRSVDGSLVFVMYHDLVRVRRGGERRTVSTVHVAALRTNGEEAWHRTFGPATAGDEERIASGQFVLAPSAGGGLHLSGVTQPALPVGDRFLGADGGNWLLTLDAGGDPVRGQALDVDGGFRVDDLVPHGTSLLAVASHRAPVRFLGVPLEGAGAVVAGFGSDGGYRWHVRLPVDDTPADARVWSEGGRVRAFSWESSRTSTPVWESSFVR